MGWKKKTLGAAGLLGTIGGLVALGMFFNVIGTAAGGPEDPGDSYTPVNGEKHWDDVKTGVGFQFPSQTASEEVVFIKQGVDAENYGSPDVDTVGADNDEDDTTELFVSSDVKEGDDYYRFNSFDSTVTSNLPDSGTYKVAVIGHGVVNQYYDYTINETNDYAFKVENDIPLMPLDGVDMFSYAADGDISTDDTFVVDGSSTISLNANYSDDTADSNVDGTVTGVKEYSISGDSKAIQAGHVEISNVNSNVEEVTITVLCDGEQVAEFTDSNPTDSDGLNDQEEFGPVTCEDEFRVETFIEFDDSAITTSSDLLTSELDDADDDSTSDDGSYGITKLTETWKGY